MTGTIVSIALQAIALVLFLAGAASLCLLFKGYYVLRRLGREGSRDDTASILRSSLAPSITALATARDGSAASRQFVRRLLGLHSPAHNVLLVLNGVSEADAAAWHQEFHLRPSGRPADGPLPAAGVLAVFESADPVPLTVVVIERASAAKAWNAGVNAASAPIVGLFDPQSEFQPDALLHMIRPMLEAPVTTVGVCAIAPAPSADGMAGQFAAVGFLRLWLARCAAFAGWNMLMPVPGCAMLVAREAVIRCGGFRAGPVELFLDLHADARASPKPYRIVLLPMPVSYAPAPRSLTELRALIVRDQREIAAALRASKSALGWGLPALFGIRFLRPLLETIAYALTAAGLAMGWVDWRLAALVLLSTVGMGIMISMTAVVLRELADYRGSGPGRLTRLFFAAIPENLWFRQARNVWLIAGFFGSRG